MSLKKGINKKEVIILSEFKEIKIRKLASDFDNTSIERGKSPANPVKRRKLEFSPVNNGIEIYKAFFSHARIEIEKKFVDVMISTYNKRTREVVILCEVSGGEIIICRNLMSKWYYYSICKRNYAYSKNAGRINLAVRR